MTLTSWEAQLAVTQSTPRRASSELSAVLSRIGHPDGTCNKVYRIPVRFSKPVYSPRVLETLSRQGGERKV